MGMEQGTLGLPEPRSTAMHSELLLTYTCQAWIPIHCGCIVEMGGSHSHWLQER